MALHGLTTGEMVRITVSWVTEGHDDRATLAAIPALAALLPEIEVIHRELKESDKHRLSIARLREIRRKEKLLTQRRDDLLRGVWYMVLAEIYLASDPALISDLRALQELLLSEGLGAMPEMSLRRSEREGPITARLCDADRALLARIRTASQTSLLDAIDEWVVLKSQLARLAEERYGEAFTGPLKRESRAARKRWIHTVGAIRAVAGLLPDIAPALAALLNRIDEAEELAHRRARNSLDAAAA